MIATEWTSNVINILFFPEVPRQPTSPMESQNHPRGELLLRNSKAALILTATLRISRLYDLEIFLHPILFLVTFNTDLNIRSSILPSAVIGREPCGPARQMRCTSTYLSKLCAKQPWRVRRRVLAHQQPESVPVRRHS